MALLAVSVVVAGCAIAPARMASIQRTGPGVAHIEAPDLESLATAVAWAHAEDNVCQTADHLVTVRGERSRHFGPTARSLLGLKPYPNEQIDFFIQWHMDDDALERAWNREASAQAQAMARGYVAGFNRYLAENRGQLPAACRDKPWLRSMTLADYRRASELAAVQAGIALFVDSVLAAQAPASRSGAVEPSPRIDLAQARAEAFERGLLEPALGSNGWAFGKQATADGRGVLLGNPHFPWDGVNRFWQFHATVPGQLDVMGAAIGLSPTPQIGFNRDVAWTHTVSTGKRFTVHELVLDGDDPTRYVIDGRTLALERRVLRVDAREADGRLATREVTVWTSRYGPLIVVPRAGLTWTTRRAYALQDANQGNARMLDVWLAIGRANSVEAVRDALAPMGLPWVNTLAADRHGQVLYADASVVPDVSADQLRRCAPNPTMAQLFAAGLPVLDGSRSECNWRRDESSPVPGITPLQRMPVIVRSDWVQNSNDSHWLSNPVQQLSGISPMVGAIGAPQRMRTRAALFEIEDRLGPHATRPTRIDRGVAQDMLLEHRNLAAQMVLDDLLAGCGRTPEASEPDVRDACEVLGRWDRRNHVESRGAHLFREWWRLAKDIPGLWRLPTNAEDPVATPAGLKLADRAVRTKVWGTLGDAVRIVKAAGFALDAPLGSVQTRPTPRGAVGVPGGEDFEGVLDKNEAQGLDRLGPRGYVVNYGASYVQAVGFDAQGPVADGLLVYGQSTDPASPRYFDGLEALRGPRWPRLPFHPRDIEAARVGPVWHLQIR